MVVYFGRARFSGNADVPVGSYVNADEDVGVPGKTRTPVYFRPPIASIAIPKTPAANPPTMYHVVACVNRPVNVLLT